MRRGEAGGGAGEGLGDNKLSNNVIYEWTIKLVREKGHKKTETVTAIADQQSAKMVWQTAQQRGCLSGHCKIRRFIAVIHGMRKNVCLCVRKRETEEERDTGCDKSAINDGKMCTYTVQCAMYNIRVGRLCLRAQILVLKLADKEGEKKLRKGIVSGDVLHRFFCPKLLF
jgi:hypothetical protein